MTDAAFDARHAPGSMTLSASLWPALVLPAEHRPAWLPSVYAYGAHLLGKAPFEPVVNKLARRGKLMEPIAYHLLEDEAGIEVIDRQRWFEHPNMRAGATLDGRVDEQTNIEIKVVNARDLDKWNGRPPLYPRVQAQAQLACSGGTRALIVPLVADTCELGPIHEELRRDDVIDALEEKGREFLALLDQGDLPAPDTSPSTIQALARVIALDPDDTLDLAADDEALLRADRWLQARADRVAAEKLEDAEERWFRVRMGKAGRATMNELEVVAKDVTRKGYAVATTKYRQYAIREVR